MCAYQLTELNVLGAEVRGIDLKAAVDDEVKESIKNDVVKYRLLIFKDQGVVDPERQVEITTWFGEPEYAGFEQHPKSPNRFLLRVSNDADEGFRDFGTAGFHVDGSFMECPNSNSIYHIIETPSMGETLFVPFREVLESLTKEQRERWNRLWFIKTFKRIRGYTDTPGHVIHPLVYPHPITGEQTMCIHLGKTGRFILDRKHKMTQEQTEALIMEINREIHRDHGKLIYSHKWEPGDFIISDNLAVGHMASEETQLPRNVIGLRVMHRSIVRGKYSPSQLKKLELVTQKECKCAIL